jgi:signal transduction histidine kinase
VAEVQVHLKGLKEFDGDHKSHALVSTMVVVVVVVVVVVMMVMSRCLIPRIQPGSEVWFVS